MSETYQHRIYLNSDNPDATIRELGLFFELSPDVLLVLRRILELYRRPAWLYVRDLDPEFLVEALFIDRFGFDIDNDALVLYDTDPLTFIDGLVEMAMYLAGFITLIGLEKEKEWMIELAAGAWKPIKKRIKQQLGLPTTGETHWVIETPPMETPSIAEQEALQALFSQLNALSFAQMVHWAARDDVEVRFPANADPSVIEVYVRMKVAIAQVAESIELEDWREFNQRLLTMVNDLEAEYRPAELPKPDPDSFPQPPQQPRTLPKQDLHLDLDDEWNPFEAYVEQLFRQQDSRDDL